VQRAESETDQIHRVILRQDGAEKESLFAAE
jgi:hypothetical protein